MPINETVLESFLSGNLSILDEIIGTDAAELVNILNSATISGMGKSDILNLVTVASSASAQRSLLNTRLNTYSRVATNTMMKDAPSDTKYVYIGPIDEKTRDECLKMAGAGLSTESEIVNAFGSGVLVDGGGFNCRHKWEIASDEGIKLFDGEEAKKITNLKQPISNSFTDMEQATKYIDEVTLETITEPENNLIKDYTNSRYDTLNSSLRSHNNLIIEKQKFPNMNIGELAEDVVKDRNLLNQALDKLPSYKNDVWRGVHFDNEKDFGDFFNSLYEGQTISRPTFTSTSTSRQLAESFATADDFGALVKIESKNGKWLNGLSAVEDEMEVLFKSDTLFEIKKIETISIYDIREDIYRDMVQITMKEI